MSRSTRRSCWRRSGRTPTPASTTCSDSSSSPSAPESGRPSTGGAARGPLRRALRLGSGTTGLLRRLLGRLATLGGCLLRCARRARREPDRLRGAELGNERRASSVPRPFVPDSAPGTLQVKHDVSLSVRLDTPPAPRGLEPDRFFGARLHASKR